MKSYIFIFVATAVCYSQSTGFAIYGVGENIQNNEPASLSMGNSLLFSGNSKNISTGSPSSLWRSSLTRFSIHTGINVLKSTQFPNQFHHNLTSFSIHFPVGNKKVFGFGLQPVYRTNKLDIENKDFQFIGADASNSGTPIAFKNSYSIDGGISEFFFEYSQKLSQHYAGGLKFSFLFGNQYHNDELHTYDVMFDTTLTGELLYEYVYGDDTLYAQANNRVITGLNNSRKFSGSTITFEGRYTYEKHEGVLSASLNSRIKVVSQNTQTTNNITYTNSFINSSNGILSKLRIGYLYKIKNNSGITMELYRSYPFSIPENIALFNIMPPKESSIHLGYYHQIINSTIGYWNNLNLRCGTYFKQLDFTGEKFIDYGATIGLGIEYLANSQSIDFALRTGKMESRFINGAFEEYISIHFGFTTGEKWFMKSRRK